MKKICVLLLALVSMNSMADDKQVINGSYSIKLKSFDWGVGVKEVILNLQTSVDNVEPKDFKISETKQVADGSDSSYPIVMSTVDRTITDAYTVDEEGNKTTKPSKHVLIELEVGMNEGSPILYTASTYLNTWSDPYYLNINLTNDSNIISQGKVVEKIHVRKKFTKMDTAADTLKLATFKASDNINLNYGYYDNKNSNTLFIWLHGSGEGGVENTDPRIPMLANKASAFLGDEFQGIMNGADVLVPQSPTFWMDADGSGGQWANGLLTTQGPSHYTNALKELIDKQKEEYHISRVIIAGASAGGYMAMRLIIDYPDYFNAAILVAEALPDKVISDEELSGIVDMPLFFIYSKEDPSIIPENFEIPTTNRLKNLGANNLHVFSPDSVIDTSGTYFNSDGTPYTYNGHSSWIYLFNNEAYSNETGESVWNWLSKQY